MLRLITELQNAHIKKVLLRIDSDVDIQDNIILDDSRLSASLPTLEHLEKHAGMVYIVGHLGRPEGVDMTYTMRPVAQWLAQRIYGAKVAKTTVGEFEGWHITDSLILLENIRFFEGEEKNDADFAKKLASLADMYVNDAFAVSHRAHASIVGVASLLPSYAGLHLQKEIEELSKVLDNPARPLAVVIGGAKIETKLPMVEKMHKIADFVLVGGEVAAHVKELVQVQHERVQDRKSVLLVADLQDNGLDITDKSAENFVEVLDTVATIVWNGPVGMTGKEAEPEESTKKIAEAIVATSAYKIVGGGDTLSYVRRIGLLGKFDFVSMGGGAMLEFLSGKTLPGIEVLETEKQKSS
jgi:phosphoglycerate kinase